MTWQQAGDVACLTLAQGQVVQRWHEGSGPDRLEVVLVESDTASCPWTMRVVMAQGDMWAAYELGPDDLAVVERLAATENLYNLGALLRPVTE